MNPYEEINKELLKNYDSKEVKSKPKADLLTFLNAFQYGFYAKSNAGKIDFIGPHETTIHPHFIFGLELHLRIPFAFTNFLPHTYGEVWALTKEELEGKK